VRGLFLQLAYGRVLLGKSLLGFEQGVIAQLRLQHPRNLERVLRRFGATIGPGVRLYAPMHLHNAARSFRNLSVGERCHLGRDFFLDLADSVHIGDRVTLSMRVTILTHLDVGDSSWAERGYPPSKAPVVIEDDVYIGAGATILPGVRIGRGALVGAAALVRRDVPAGARVAGVPARSIGTRS
jgi:acetyltransferase-like isoleucine patch superfamily enzyme